MLDNLRSSLINYRGSSIDKKIIVFQSDDWGSIRMPSKKVFEILSKNNINVQNSAYCKFDSLESNDDLEHLFSIISKYKDKNGNHPIFTANTIVANPDFEKIRISGFKDYFYEPFTETLKKYKNSSNVLNLYKEGIDSKIFHPQFHGREHVNIEMWLELLQKKHNDFMLAFDNHMWGLSYDVFPNMNKSIQATFDSRNDGLLADSIVKGLELFNNIFDFQSDSFMANNFIWNASLNKLLAENNIKYLQTMKYQILPKLGESKRVLIRHFHGEKNQFNQTYLVRNCSFEPSINGYGFEKTIKEIGNAFFWKKPAIISTHRINFIGFLDERNRTSNLKSFSLLLENILKKWPDVEFMTTVSLGHLISQNRNPNS
jgi:hypothetical protein